MRKKLAHNILTTLSLSLSVQSLAFKKDIQPALSPSEHPQVLTVPNPAIYNANVAQGRILVPTRIDNQDVLEGKKKPRLVDFASLKTGTLMKFVICSADTKNPQAPLVMRAGSKKESKKLSKAMGITVEVLRKNKKKIKLKTLHHATFNNWGPIKTAGVLYLTEQRTGNPEILISIESGKYGLDGLEVKDVLRRMSHLNQLKTFLEERGIKSKLITPVVWVTELNPNGLLEFPEEKAHEASDKPYKKKKSLLSIELK